MIHVLVKRSGDCVQLLHVEGHAQPAARRGGQYDLICAAVSALMSNLLEGFDLLECSQLAQIDQRENAVRITPQDDPRQQVLVQSVVRSLAGIEREYGKYLEIHMMEV